MLYTKNEIINHLVSIQDNFAYYAVNATPEQEKQILDFAKMKQNKKIAELQNYSDQELIAIYEKQKHCIIRKFSHDLFFISESPLTYSCQLLSML
jgi:hypothetical protein